VQIVRQTRFDKGMISRTLKRMHKKELEHVETSESDRRSYVVDVTPQDRTVIERARPMMRQRQNRFQQAFDREELDTLFRAFKNSDSVLDHMEEQH